MNKEDLPGSKLWNEQKEVWSTACQATILGQKEFIQISDAVLVLIQVYFLQETRNVAQDSPQYPLQQHTRVTLLNVHM